MITGPRKKSDKYARNKMSVYIPTEMRKELLAQSEYQERTVSWLIQKAWEISKGRIAAYGPPPTADFVEPKMTDTP